MTRIADYFISHAGIADNPGIDKESLEAMRREFANNPSQLAARERGLFVKPTGLVLMFDPDRHFIDLSVEDTVKLLKRSRVFAGMDFGEWRFGVTLWCADPDGVLYLIDEYFDHRSDSDTRAEELIKLFKKYEITKRFPIYGDCASPRDIREMNLSFGRKNAIYRVTAVDAQKKIIKAGVTRMGNLMARKNPVAFRVRRTTGESLVWKAGYGASSPGIPVSGSRWLWEVNNWQYPKNEDSDKSQKDVPDDNTADGADLMDTSRYAIMSWWKAGKEPEPEEEPSAFSPENLAEDAERSRTIKHRMKRRREGPRREIDRSWGEY